VVGFVVARGSQAAGAGATAAANDYGPAAAPGRLLARLVELTAGGGVVLADQKIVLTRGPDDTVRGFSAVCTHQGCPVTAVRDGVIICPCHASQFDAATGQVVSGPATRPLPPVAVVVRDDGVFTT
jgi:Rieske Fe-S protein